MSIKVTLRQKPISGGSRQSLYLDFYPMVPHPLTGKPTRRQFLNLYLYDKAKAPDEKKHNKDVLAQAEYLCQIRKNEVNKPEIYSGYEKEQLRQKELASQSFYDYHEKLASKREEKTQRIWHAVLGHLKAFHEEELRFSDINEAFCNDFKAYLLSTKLAKTLNSKLSNNTAGLYFSKFKTALKQAYKDGFIQIDLNSKLQGIKAEETRRNILTLDEVNALVEAECSNPVLKQAAIFSIYTGLRFSDIQNLTWGEIENIAGNYVIHFKQQKTKGIETLPISPDALLFVGDRKADNVKVFEGLQYSAYHNVALAKWIGLAGITKDITFHSFRHTYATLQLSLGTDIYTVSKMLGHRDVKTTQIYAKYLDENKRAAANRIQLNINNWK